jgi:hypothetical protein
MSMDFGRQAFVDLMASKDPAIKGLLEQGYEFVTNAFQSGSKPVHLRVKDAGVLVAQLEREGHVAALCSAYDEVGDPIPGMQSVWRKRQGAGGR